MILSLDLDRRRSLLIFRAISGPLAVGVDPLAARPWFASGFSVLVPVDDRGVVAGFVARPSRAAGVAILGGADLADELGGSLVGIVARMSGQDSRPYLSVMRVAPSLSRATPRSPVLGMVPVRAVSAVPGVALAAGLVSVMMTGGRALAGSAATVESDRAR
jgi:hypothetical protein